MDINFASASATSEELTDFWTVFAGAGWGPIIQPHKSVSFQPSLVIGNMYMNFADEEVGFRKRESEFYFGFKTLITFDIGSHFGVGFDHTWTNTFTQTPIRLSRMGGHLRFRIPLPNKVTDALK